MTINDLWTKFKTTLTTLTNEHIPSNLVKGNGNLIKPCITAHVNNLRKKLSRLFKKSKWISNQADRARYYIKTKARIQREERQSYWRYINNLIVPPEEDEPVSQGSNQKRFWSYVKSLRRDNTGVAPLKDQGRLYPLPRDKANILNHQYQSVFTKEDLADIPSPSGDPFPPMKPIEISEAGVHKLLHSTNPHPCCRLDLHQRSC